MDQADRDRVAERGAVNREFRTVTAAPAAIPGGPCRQCGNHTEAVVVWNGKAAFLCPPCGEAIRKAA